MEVIYDLDVEAAEVCAEIGMNLVRSAVVGCHPRFVAMIRELIQERLVEKAERRFLGEFGPSPDVCPDDCCKWQSRRAT
jgi:ferrochelatase